jgi:hypothetical protein
LGFHRRCAKSAQQRRRIPPEGSAVRLDVFHHPQIGFDDEIARVELEGVATRICVLPLSGLLEGPIAVVARKPQVLVVVRDDPGAVDSEAVVVAERKDQLSNARCKVLHVAGRDVIDAQLCGHGTTLIDRTKISGR